jgi:hypothetical protein
VFRIPDDKRRWRSTQLKTFALPTAMKVSMTADNLANALSRHSPPRFTWIVDIIRPSRSPVSRVPNASQNLSTRLNLHIWRCPVYEYRSMKTYRECGGKAPRILDFGSPYCNDDWKVGQEICSFHGTWPFIVFTKAHHWTLLIQSTTSLPVSLRFSLL